MTTKTIPALVAIVAALTLGACGGDDGGGDTLAKADLAKKANEICAKYDKESDGVKQPTNVANANEAAPYFRSIHEIGQKRQDDLTALKPADDVKADYDAFLAVQKKLVDLIDQIATAAEKKDAATGAKLLAQAQTGGLDKESTDAANKVGAKTCGG
jgi:hypothetical protein